MTHNSLKCQQDLMFTGQTHTKQKGVYYRINVSIVYPLFCSGAIAPLVQCWTCDQEVRNKTQRVQLLTTPRKLLVAFCPCIVLYQSWAMKLSSREDNHRPAIALGNRHVL